MNLFWTLDRLADALSGLTDNVSEGLSPGLRSLRRDPGYPRGNASIASISTDTRTIKPTDCFVALIGDRFDGHDHIITAIEAGAAAIVASKPLALGQINVPVYVVDDTLVALGALASYWRRVWNGKVVAVAGSNGKTSTKELVSAVLKEKFEVHSTRGNFNNQVGVPLTLLSIPENAQVAVVEVGTSLKGEIEMLRKIVSPDISIVTNIGEEHLEGFGDLAGVLQEEASIADGVEWAIVPDEFSDLVAEVNLRVKRGLEDSGNAGKVLTVGLDAGDIKPKSWTISSNGLGSFDLDGTNVSPPFRGVHNLKNSMLAVGVGRLFGMSDVEIAEGLSKASEPAMRGQWETYGEAIVINDAYNANPASMRTSIATLAASGASQKVAILGSMRELGPNSPAYHEDIAKLALQTDGISLVAAVGEMGEAIKRVAPNDLRVITAAEAEIDDLWTLLKTRLDKSATILVKASRGVKLERIISHIQAWSNS